MNIVIIDDNKDICEMLENILLSEGLKATSCFNPLEAKALILSVKPKLIITDMLMSGVDGRTLTKELKNDPQTSHIKIMMMSAHPDGKSESAKIGVDDFLAKPFEIEHLMEKVHQLVDKCEK